MLQLVHALFHPGFYCRWIGACDRSNLSVLQTVEAVKHNDLSLDLGQLHKSLDKQPGILLPDNIQQQIALYGQMSRGFSGRLLFAGFVQGE